MKTAKKIIAKIVADHKRRNKICRMMEAAEKRAASGEFGFY